MCLSVRLSHGGVDGQSSAGPQHKGAPPFRKGVRRDAACVNSALAQRCRLAPRWTSNVLRGGRADARGSGGGGRAPPAFAHPHKLTRLPLRHRQPACRLVALPVRALALWAAVEHGGSRRTGDPRRTSRLVEQITLVHTRSVTRSMARLLMWGCSSTPPAALVPPIGIAPQAGRILAPLDVGAKAGLVRPPRAVAPHQPGVVLPPRAYGPDAGSNAADGGAFSAFKNPSKGS